MRDERTTSGGVSDPRDRASGSGGEPQRGVAHAPARPALRLCVARQAAQERRLHLEPPLDHRAAHPSASQRLAP